jgi:hypothetical protein
MRIRIEEEVITFSVPVKIRNPHQAPRRRNTWPIGSSDKHIIVQVPNRRLAGARFVKDIIGLQVIVKSAGRHQCPAARRRRTPGAADKRDSFDSRKIPDRRPARTGVEQSVIWAAVAIEILHIHYSPANRQSRSKGPADKDAVIQIPHGRPARARVVKQVIWFAVTVEV